MLGDYIFFKLVPHLQGVNELHYCGLVAYVSNHQISIAYLEPSHYPNWFIIIKAPQNITEY